MDVTIKGKSPADGVPREMKIEFRARESLIYVHVRPPNTTKAGWSIKIKPSDFVTKTLSFIAKFATKR